jgi:hypothetical protein
MVLAWVLRVSLLVCALALLRFVATADAAWFGRHVEVLVFPGPVPPWILPAVRGAGAVLGLGLAASAVSVPRAVKWDAVARVGVAAALAVGASEVTLRVVHRLRRTPAADIEAFLATPDPRTGWAYVPGRTVDLPVRGSGRVIHYGIDAQGDRAPSAGWIEDADAPTVLVAGESVAAGYALQWDEAFPARLGELLHTQVVDVAESGYGSDQAYLRTVDALARFAHPVAVVTTVLPVQLWRNLHEDRPHLVLDGGRLVLVPALPSHLVLHRLWADEVPYLSEADLTRSLALTRSILQDTAQAARARGAQPLFVLIPVYGPPRSVEEHLEAFIIHALLDGLPHIVMDLDLSRRLPGDGHPDAEAARQIAAAIAKALEAPGDARGHDAEVPDVQQRHFAP